MATTLQQLQKSIELAKSEPMTIVKHGAVNNEGFVVIHDDKAYVVEVKDNVITSCTCPHHTFRGVACKHMVKVSLDKELDLNVRITL